MEYITAIRNLGISLSVFGIVLLAGYGFYGLFTSEASMILKLSIAFIASGIILAILSLIREKKDIHDTEVERKY